MGRRRSGSGRGRAARAGGERNWGLIIVAVAVVAVIGAFIAVVAIDFRSGAASGPPSGVENVDVGEGGQHSEGQIDYAQTPPAGGEHNPVWQNCGFYSEPIRSENAVHSLEHGAVWITYRPDLAQEQVEELREIAESRECVLVSPYPDLDAPVVASAWSKQLELEGADDPALNRFIGTYLRGEQTPEPGAACTGGVGEPA